VYASALVLLSVIASAPPAVCGDHPAVCCHRYYKDYRAAYFQGAYDYQTMFNYPWHPAPCRPPAVVYSLPPVTILQPLPAPPQESPVDGVQPPSEPLPAP
jgi:hypothetical protein